MAGVQGVSTTTLYWGQVYIPSLGLMMKGMFLGVDLTGQEPEVLLGRTLLHYFRMTYDGPTGRVQLRKGLAEPTTSPLTLHRHEFHAPT